MKKRFRIGIGAVLLASALAGGCARIAVHFESPEGRAQRLSPIPTRRTPEDEAPRVVEGKTLPSRTQTVAFLGLHNFSSPVDVAKECPHGWGEFTTHVTGIQALLHVLTLNLYSPWTVETACRPYLNKPAEL